MTAYPHGAIIIGTWIAAGITIAIYSFLYKDNPFYKLAENIYIGVSTGYIIVKSWTEALRPLLVRPLLYPESNLDYIMIIPGLLGILMFTRYFRKIAWVSRISLAFLIGYGAGIAAPANIQAFLIRHTGKTIVPLFNAARFQFTPLTICTGLFSLALLGTLVYFVQKDKYTDWEPGRRFILVFATVAFGIAFFLSACGFSVPALMNVFCNLVILVGVISVLFYFFYSIEHKKSLKGLSKVGILFLMVFFGSAFGYTVMGRVSLAIGRMRFLVNDWIKQSTGSQWLIAIPIAAIIAGLLLWQERAGRISRGEQSSARGVSQK